MEPNDTFKQEYSNVGNSIGVSDGNTTLMNATISTSTDIDIFNAWASYTNTVTITQNNNLNNVSCNIYQKTTGGLLQTNTSVPDSSYSYQGKLNPSYSISPMSDVVSIYIICNGTAGTAYSIQTNAPNSASTDAFTSAYSMYSDFSSISNCKAAAKTCETKCSLGF